VSEELREGDSHDASCSRPIVNRPLTVCSEETPRARGYREQNWRR
jgi:hypothetical protein